MSHFSEIKTQMKDEKIIRTCLSNMGFLLSDKKIVKGYRGQEQVDLAVSSQGGYLIGLRRGVEGNFEIVADWWGVKGTSEKEFVTNLRKKYTEEQTQVFAKNNRFTVNRTAVGKKTRLELVRRTY